MVSVEELVKSHFKKCSRESLVNAFYKEINDENMFEFFDVDNLLVKKSIAKKINKHIREEEFIDKIANYMGVGYDMNKINISRRHTSYNEKQLKAIFHISKRIDIRRKRTGTNKTIRVIKGLIPNMIRYTTLYLALLFPDSIFGTEVLIPSESLEEIKKHYNDDWEQCAKYAMDHNPI